MTVTVRLCSTGEEVALKIGSDATLAEVVLAAQRMGGMSSPRGVGYATSGLSRDSLDLTTPRSKWPTQKIGNRNFVYLHYHIGR